MIVIKIVSLVAVTKKRKTDHSKIVKTAEAFKNNDHLSREMPHLTLHPAVLGDLPITECRYQLRADTVAMPSFDRVYLHTTYKYTDLPLLLDYSVTKRGFAGIGYHFVIDRTGTIFATRPLQLQGAHVYGRNQKSVGISFFNIDACAQSRRAKESFRELYKTLHKISSAQISPTQSLPIYSHTYGQFDYLRERTRLFNSQAQQQAEISEVPFDTSVCLDPVFYEKVNQARRALSDFSREVQDHPLDDQVRNSFRRLGLLVEALKICPGKHFMTFAQEIAMLTGEEIKKR